MAGGGNTVEEARHMQQTKRRRDRDIGKKAMKRKARIEIDSLLLATGLYTDASCDACEMDMRVVETNNEEGHVRSEDGRQVSGIFKSMQMTPESSSRARAVWKKGDNRSAKRKENSVRGIANVESESSGAANMQTPGTGTVRERPFNCKERVHIDGQGNLIELRRVEEPRVDRKPSSSEYRQKEEARPKDTDIRLHFSGEADFVQSARKKTELITVMVRAYAEYVEAKKLDDSETLFIVKVARGNYEKLKKEHESAYE